MRDKPDELCLATPSAGGFCPPIPGRDDDPKSGYSRRTINGIMKVIKAALKDAVQMKILPYIPSLEEKEG